MESNQYTGGLEPIILRLPGEKKEMYGYENTQPVKDRSNDEITINEGSLYPLLHKMERKGIIKSEIRKVGNRSRKYYHLTEDGIAISQGIFEKMRKYLNIMGKIFNPKMN